MQMFLGDFLEGVSLKKISLKTQISLKKPLGFHHSSGQGSRFQAASETIVTRAASMPSVWGIFRCGYGNISRERRFEAGAAKPAKPLG
jgi:hypothetical protein